MKTCKTTPYAVLALCLAMFVPFTAVASPPDKAQVPEDAKWVICLDLEALSQTALAEEVRGERPHLAQVVQRWFQTKYGLDPRKDLDSLTMFSNTYDEHTGTMILKADYDQDKVKAALEERPGVQKESWEGHTLYTLIGDRPGLLLRPGAAEPQRGQRPATGDQQQGKPMYIVLVNGNTVVFASSPDRAKAGVKLTKGEAPTLAEDSPLLSELKEGAMVYGAAVDLEQIEQRDGIYPILSQHERIYWTVRKENDEVVGNLTLHAKSEEVAEHMKTSLEGSVAFGKVWAGDSENLKKLMDSREVSRDGKTVKATGRGDSQTVLNAIRELRGRLEQRMQTAAR